jgi:alkaline phosphatase D
MLLTMFKLVTLLSLASISAASFASNINYRSPSHHHPALGVSIRKVAARNEPSSAWQASQLNFTHGVASGDPYDNSVILWTRAAPSMDDDASNVTVSGYVPLYSHETAEYVKASKAPVCVEYKVAIDRGFKTCIDSGRVYTSSDIDYTIKVEARNLRPYTRYCKFVIVCETYQADL